MAIGLAGGMGTESTHCSPSLSTVGISKTVSLTAGSYLTVSGIVTVRIPTAMNALVVCLGSAGATVSVGSGSGNVTWNAEG